MQILTSIMTEELRQKQVYSLEIIRSKIVVFTL